MRTADWRDNRLASSRAQEPGRARCRADASDLPADADRQLHQFRTAASWNGCGWPAGELRRAQVRRLGGEQGSGFHRDNLEEEALMSVAFRRESDEEHLEPKFELPIPAGPNLVTARGLQLIEERIAELEASIAHSNDPAKIGSLQRDLSYW